MFRLVTVAVLALGVHPLFGGVVLDGSFGTSGALPGPNYMISSTVGKQVGTNLFHSFSQLDLISSESATFSGPSNIQNILARVTSGSASSIDGLVRSDIAGANLFLLNPAGVLFGAHAQIDVSGSFAVSTANYVKLADGGRFNTSLGGQDVLTSAPVTAFGFLTSAPAPVTITGSTLNVAPAKSFSIVAGDVTLDGGTITGEGSSVNAVSVRSVGEAQLDATNLATDIDVTQFTILGEIDLTNLAQIAVSGPQGGGVIIRGGKLDLNNSQIISETMGILDGLSLDVGISGELDIENHAIIFTNTLGSANGSNLNIHAGSLSIDGSASPGLFTGIAVQSSGGATGNAGSLAITIDQALSIVATGEIFSSTLSSGRGGNLSIYAGSLLIDGSATPGFFTGISANALEGTGNGGDLSIIVSQGLSVAGSGQITADTSSSGNGGNLSIQAGSFSIDGSATPDFFTGVSADAIGGTGNAGDLSIIVSQGLSVAGSGQITADTFSSGNGGNLSIQAGSFSIDGSATPDFFTGISAEAVTGTGNGGDLTVTLDGLLSIRGGAEIKTDTFTNGKGGDLKITAGSILIDGSATPDVFTGISAEADDGMDSGGNIIIDADNMCLRGGGSISAASFTSAPAGSVQLSLATLSMDSGSSISSANTGTGSAGNVIIDTTGSMKLAGGSSISTSSKVGDAGSIDLISSGIIRLREGSSITASAGANGGNIHLTAPDLIYLTDSSVTATAGSTGGNITIDNPQFIILKNSLISANAIDQGGDINLVSDFFFNSDSLITATGTTNGTVNITAPDLDLGATLITLPSSLLSAETQLRERCTAQLRGDFSSFITLGRGGTEPAPDELQPAF